ncbi:OmpP1/FadL family transporter [Roseibium aquae]|nr:outer membrane protein transport protein [Roseibium aquae]
MKIAIAISIALSGTAHAGGFERIEQSMAVLFEQGRHFQIGGYFAFPRVSGVGSSISPTPGQNSGNLAENFWNINAAFKDDINDRFSYAIIFDNPYGANIAYPSSGFFASNSNASITTHALSGVLQYNMPETLSVFGGSFSIYGGPKVQYSDAHASIPFTFGGYSATVDPAFGFGFLAGVAFEKPDIGMRIALTYGSAINTNWSTTESFGNLAGGAPVATTTAFDTPESLNLEFQTGLNPKTLLFGSVRWVPWSDFDISPPLYTSITGGPLAFFADDRITYRLGLGRKITEDFSIFGEVGYEHHTGSPTTNLTPVDGFLSYSLGATKEFGRTKVTLAGRYVDVGDADSQLGPFVPAGEFKDNSLFAIGMRIGFDLN